MRRELRRHPTPQSDMAAGIGFLRKFVLIGALGLGATWVIVMIPLLTQTPLGQLLFGVSVFLGLALFVIFAVGLVLYMVLKILTFPLRLFFGHRYRHGHAKD